MDLTSDRATREIKSLISDAQDMFNSATSASADKASALRSEGMRMLENALSAARDMQSSAMETGKELASTADDYVRENPWTTVAISAGVALLLGAVIAPMLTKK
ncbi:DUF883 family protein [Noviherbaspirillum pedocola]|uniref:DUF883 domain-containing protein n=1 Tax=Noviherbaspirillum pedocola TaxID=2801341 RepID=A0A934SXP4_9BURK|nr:DUF883 family protein [Noviherbaspirillum pedocola]MBK4734609.1 DUF883 domain-containing protein [Noviherbaspirillum pedocola]